MITTTAQILFTDTPGGWVKCQTCIMAGAGSYHRERLHELVDTLPPEKLTVLVSQKNTAVL